MNGEEPIEKNINSESESSTSETSEKSTRRKRTNQFEPPNFKICESCHAHYDTIENIKTCKNCMEKQQLIQKIAELEIEISNIVEENDNLRIGMREILEKLRNPEGVFLNTYNSLCSSN